MTTDTAASPKPSRDDCSALFVRALHGDGDAATQLYRECIPDLRHWLSSRVPWHDAEDLAHEALILAFKHGSRFQRDRSFRPWLRTIASRLAINLNRDEVRRRSRELSYTDLHRSLPLTSVRDPKAQALALCLTDLSDSDLHLIHLRFDENRTPAEIAEAQGRNRVAVSVHLHRVSRRLQRQVRTVLNMSGDLVSPPQPACMS